jgi:hypothetical protein
MELAVRRIPMTVSLLASPRNDPLVRYGAAGTGVFVEGAGSAPIPIDECQTGPAAT